jgi:predicted secreted protein
MKRSTATRCILFVAWIAVAAIGLGGCLRTTHALTEADDGSLVIIDRGDMISIRLSGNASTGYLWERVTPEAFDGTSLEPIEEAGYESLGSAPGSPGLFTFRYAAAAPGTVTLRFVHHRPWEDEPPLDEATFIVWVQ